MAYIASKYVTVSSNAATAAPTFTNLRQKTKGTVTESGVESGKPEEAAARVKATAMTRLVGCVLLCVVFIAVFKTNVYATLIPMLFPRIGIVFWPRFNRNRGTEQPGTEGSDLID